MRDIITIMQSVDGTPSMTGLETGAHYVADKHSTGQESRLETDFEMMSMTDNCKRDQCTLVIRGHCQARQTTTEPRTRSNITGKL